MEEYRLFFEDYEISNMGNVRRKSKNIFYKNKRFVVGSIKSIRIIL